MIELFRVGFVYNWIQYYHEFLNAIQTRSEKIATVVLEIIAHRAF